VAGVRRIDWLGAFVSLTILTTALVLAIQLRATDLGFTESGRGGERIVLTVDPDGPAARSGIAPGDVIVRDPGVSSFTRYWTERELYAWCYRVGIALRAGHVPMTVRHDGMERELDVVPIGPTRAAAIREAIGLIRLLPACFAFLAMAALLAWRAPNGDRVRRRLALAFACLGPVMAINWPQAFWPSWMLLLSILVLNVGSVIGVLLLCDFAWSVPTPIAFASRRPIRLAAAALAGVGASLSVLDDLHVIRGPVPGNIPQFVANILLAMALVTGLLLQRRRAVGRVARRQAGILLGSICAAVFPPVALLFLPRMFGFYDELVFDLSYAFMSIVPIAFAAVTVRFRLFALDGMAPRAIAYAIVVVTSLLVYIAIINAADAALDASSSAEKAMARGVALLAVVAIGEPLRAFVLRRLARAFARDRETFLARCSKLATLVARARPDEVEALVLRTLDANDVRFVEPLWLDAGARDRLEAEVVRRGAVRVLELSDAAVVDVLVAKGLDIVVAVPIPRAGATEVRVLGVSAALEPHLWDRLERDALANVGRVLGNAIAEHEARLSLQATVERNEEERQRIAMELHDGLGATLTAARLMAQLARTRGGEGDLETLEGTIKGGLDDLRVALWALDATDASWPSLVARVRRFAGDLCASARLPLEVVADETTTVAPSAAVRLAILRVSQEAVHNSVKHAKATRIAVTLRASDEEISLSVEDDGVGIADVERSGGFGLANMQRRIERAGGTLDVERKAPCGTRVRARIPHPSHGRAMPRSLS
jgi:signal transduction histidine kinase